MVELTIILDGTKERSGPDFSVESFKQAVRLAVIGMPEGMTSGNASVLFRLTFADGTEVWAETSLRLLGTAADALRAKYPDRAMQ